MEVSVEGGTLVREFSVRIKKGSANKHFPLTTRLWWLKIQGNIWQEGFGVVIMLGISLITIAIELSGNLVALLGLVFFYFIKLTIQFFYWFLKLILKTIFGSIGKGLGMLSIGLAIFIIYYLFDSGKWQILYALLQRLSSSF